MPRDDSITSVLTDAHLHVLAASRAVETCRGGMCPAKPELQHAQDCICMMQAAEPEGAERPEDLIRLTLATNQPLGMLAAAVMDGADPHGPSGTSYTPDEAARVKAEIEWLRGLLAEIEAGVARQTCDAPACAGEPCAGLDLRHPPVLDFTG